MNYNRIKMYDEVDEKIVNVPITAIERWMVVQGEYGYRIAVLTDRYRLLFSHNIYYRDVGVADRELSEIRRLLINRNICEEAEIYRFLFYSDEAYFKYVSAFKDKGVKLSKDSDEAKLLRQRY